MKILNTQSLAATLDAVNEVFFVGRPLTVSQKREALAWIAGRSGRTGSYANMPAPTKRDFAAGVRLFTGELVRTRAGTAHILGEEACRAMILLDPSGDVAGESLTQATAGMMHRLRGESRSGMYCCGKCSCALWRHLAVGGMHKPERLLRAGMNALKAHRDGKGRWNVFPFYYTLLALSEIDLPGAVKEIQYAASSLERVMKRSVIGDKYNHRRRILAERVLARC